MGQNGQYSLLQNQHGYICTTIENIIFTDASSKLRFVIIRPFAESRYDNIVQKNFSL